MSHTLIGHLITHMRMKQHNNFFEPRCSDQKQNRLHITSIAGTYRICDMNCMTHCPVGNREDGLRIQIAIR